MVKKKTPTSEANPAPKLVVINDAVGAEDNTQEEAFDMSQLPRIKYSYAYNENKEIAFYVVEVEKEDVAQDDFETTQLELREKVWDIIVAHADAINKLRARRNQESN